MKLEGAHKILNDMESIVVLKAIRKIKKTRGSCFGHYDSNCKSAVEDKKKECLLCQKLVEKIGEF